MCGSNGRTRPWVVWMALVVAAVGGRLQAVDAWGKIGHQAVANVAWTLLDNQTQNAVSRALRGVAPEVHSVCAEPCSPLAYVADWADTARYSHEYHWSGPLHFINIQDDALPQECHDDHNPDNDWRPICSFVASRDCPDQQCVSGAIVNYTERLMKGVTTAANEMLGTKVQQDDPEQFKVALMFVTHFVGDIHQPLHVSRKTDRGGNTIAVHLSNWTTTTIATSTPPVSRVRHLRRRMTAYPGRRGLTTSHEGLNLHAVWDDSMIDTFCEQNAPRPSSSFSLPQPLHHHDGSNKEDRQALEHAMHTTIRHAQKSGTTWANWIACPRGYALDCTTAWAQESWVLARERAYVHVEGRPVVTGDILLPFYYEHNMPVILERLAMAAVRLAITLQIAMGG